MDLEKWIEPLPDGATQLMLIGDSQIVCNWRNALAKVRGAQELIRCIQSTLHKTWCAGLCVSWSRSHNIFQQVYRELNGRADALATEGIVTYGRFRVYHDLMRRPRRIRGYFDGGCREGVMGSGWLVQGLFEKSAGGGAEWRNLCEAGCGALGEFGYR